MLMFHDGRMGLAGAPVCRAPLWPAPPSHWFAPHHTVPAMTEIIEYRPPSSTQSDSDSSHSTLSEEYYPSRVQSSQNSSNSAPVSATIQGGALQCRWKGCSEQFRSLEGLSAHVAASHADVEGGMFYCGWEGCARGHRGFNARYKMLVHVRTHTNERPHQCSVCQKSFSRAENLKIHSRSHSGEKPYICPVEGCNKAYSNSSDRFKHTRTHSVDKPYCCKIVGCQKRYTDPSSLRKHVKTYKHASVSPNPSENDSQVKILTNNDHNSTIQPQNFTPQHEARLFTSVSPLRHPNTSLSESEMYETSIKCFQRKYSYSENDSNMSESTYRVDYRSQTPPVINTKIEDESNKLCFCKDLPCIHTSRYVNPEYISIESLPYNVQTPKTAPFIRTSAVEVDSRIGQQYFNEPLNLKRCSETPYIYEDTYGVLNLEKKAKTEVLNSEINFDTPLDLSNKRFV